MSATPAIIEDKEGTDSRSRERAANFSREKGNRTARSDRDNWRDKSSGISTSSENVNSGTTIASNSLNGEKEQRKFERKERPISSTSSQWKNERDSTSSKDRSSDPFTSGVTKLSPKDLMWEYLDPQGEIQGPFGDMEMNEWYEAGFFTPSLLVKRVHQPQFTELDVLISAMDPNSNRPFFTPASMLSSLVTTPHTQKEKDVDSAPEKQIVREEKAWSKNISKQSIPETPTKLDSQVPSTFSDTKENEFQEVKSKRGTKNAKQNANSEPLPQNTSTTSTNIEKSKKKVPREEDILAEKFGVSANTTTSTSSTTSVNPPPKTTTSPPPPPQVNIEKTVSAVPITTTNAWGVVSSSTQVAPVSITMQLQPQAQTQLKRKEGVFVIDESKGTAIPVQMPMQIPQGTTSIPVIQQQVPQRQSIPPSSQPFNNPPMYPFVPQPVPVCFSPFFFFYFTNFFFSPHFLNTISLLLV